MASLALAALAEAAAPYGIEAFQPVLEPLWTAAKQQHGKLLAESLKAIGCLLALMEPEHASYYAVNVMPTLLRQLAAPELRVEMLQIVLSGLRQSLATNAVGPEYVRLLIMPDFFARAWERKMVLDTRGARQLVDTALEIAGKVGGAEVIARLVEGLKDEAEAQRSLVLQTVAKVVSVMGTADLDSHAVDRLMDGTLYAYIAQEEHDTRERKRVLSGVAAVVNALLERAKPYLPQICGTLKWRLHNKSTGVRMQAADLTASIVGTLNRCDEPARLQHMAVVLFERRGVPGGLGLDPGSAQKHLQRAGRRADQGIPPPTPPETHFHPPQPPRQGPAGVRRPVRTHRRGIAGERGC